MIMNPKTILSVLMTLIMLSSIAYAGSIHDAQYYDKYSNWWYWHGGTIRTLNDNDVRVDADTVGGVDVVQKLKKTKRYIKSNEDAWLEDKVGGSGISYSTVQRFVTGMNNWTHDKPYGYSVYDEISLMYATLEQVEATNNRLDYIESWLTVGTNEGDDFDMTMAKMRAMRTDTITTMGRYKCYPVGICFES